MRQERRAYFQTVEAARRCRDMIYSCSLYYNVELTGPIKGGYVVAWDQ